MTNVTPDDAERARLSALRHDLYSPLNALFGALEMLETTLEGQLSPGSAHMLEIARRSGERMLELIEARLAAGEVPAAEA